MAIYDKYENLPGVKVNYEDGNLFTGSGNDAAKTQSVLIIGSAIDGPVGQVVSLIEAGGARAAETLYGGQVKKTVREAVASIAEYNVSYSTVTNLGENVIRLAKVTESNPIVLSTLTIREAGTALKRVTKVTDLESGKFFYDVEQNLVKFADPMIGVKVTYEVLKDVVVEMPHQGSLVRSMYELVNAGCEDIRMIRINGTRAQLKLLVKNKGTQLLDVLGNGGGSQTFAGSLKLDKNTADKAELVKGTSEFAGIRYVREINIDGTVANEYSGNAVSKVISSIDHTQGAEGINFRSGVFRPKNKIEVGYHYTRRTFVQVLDNEGTGNEVLTKSLDLALPNYFEAPNKFWSTEGMHAGDFNVYVESTAAGKAAVPQFNLALEKLWGFGKDGGDVPTTEGGISFTDVYNNWAIAQSPQYPKTTDAGFKVTSSYWYYSDTTPILADNIGYEYQAPGADQTFALRYPPTEQFEVYYELPDKEKVSLEEKTSANANGVFTVDVSGETPSITVDAGAVPVGLRVIASYNTLGAQTLANPYLLIEGKYEGSVYGQMINEDSDIYSGVEVEVTLDEELESVVTFYKPTEKQLTANDKSVTYELRKLRGLTTLGEFANYVNNDGNNNIVRITPMSGSAGLPIESFIETNGRVRLGSEYNADFGEYQMKIDDSKAVNDEMRYPLCGRDGFFDSSSLESAHDLYQTLGGKYVANNDGSYQLVEQGLYSTIENYPVDIILLLDTYSNTRVGKLGVNSITGEQEWQIDENKSFATQLAQHCAVLSAKSSETMGYIGVAPAPSTNLISIQEYIDELINTPGLNDHFMYNEATHEVILNEEGNRIDVGGYLGNVFGPEVGMTNHKLGSYVASPISLIAGLVSDLVVENAPTNKEIAASTVRYNLSEPQMNQLAAARYITIERKRLLNGSTKVVVKDGVSAAQPNSDYQRISTMRITHAVVRVIRSAADPYIGLPNGLAQRNALSTEIQSSLDKMKEAGVIQDFKYTIYTSAKEQVLGNAFITLELVPAFEMRKIHTNVSLRSSL